MEVAYKDGVKYVLDEFLLESDFEKIVLSQYKHIFGKESIIFDKYKIKSSTGIGTIPDAFVLCPKEEKWYVIEIELSSHSVYNHIVPQISKFKVALKSNRKKLISFFDKQIEEDIYKKADWYKAVGSHNNVHRDLSVLIDKEPELVVIIDNISQDLIDAKDTFGFKTDILAFRCFSRVGSNRSDSIYVFEEFLNVKNSKSNIAFQTTKSNIQAPASSTQLKGTNSLKSGQTNSVSISPVRRVSNKSLDPKVWAQNISDLKSVNSLKTWKDICDYLNINVGTNSAYRVLKKWVYKNKPEWPSVP